MYQENLAGLQLPAVIDEADYAAENPQILAKKLIEKNLELVILETFWPSEFLLVDFPCPSVISTLLDLVSNFN